jgi:hypothetical protein
MPREAPASVVTKLPLRAALKLEASVSSLSTGFGEHHP